MLGFNGGLVGKERLATATPLGASGLWLPNEQSVAKRASKWPFGPNEVPNIGESFGGGFFAGYISHTADSVATHALIVGPRATAASGTGYTLTTNYQLKTSLSNTAGTTSTFDGRANTDAMITGGIASHPAAQFCVNLNIAGFTDWYLPAWYELEIAYFNLKPTTTSNITTVGINAYAVPARASNYTAGTPAMASGTAAAFNSTGAERFEGTENPSNHWTSTQVSTTQNKMLGFFNGNSSNADKTNSLRVRAFRRVTL